MRNEELLFRVPEWAIAASLVAAMFASLEIGRRYGTRDRNRLGETDEESSSLSGAALGLLGLLLAFTYSVATGHFDLRKQMVLKESNEIGTAILRAGFAPEPQRRELQELLAAYVDVRVAFAASTLDSAAYSVTERETERLQDAFWKTALRSVEGRVPTPLDALLFDSLNGVIDVSSERLRANRDHVPEVVIWLLSSVAFAAVGLLGYAAGRKGERRQWVRALLPVLIAAVIVLILDLDRPARGLIRVSQLPLLDLQQSLRK